MKLLSAVVDSKVADVDEVVTNGGEPLYSMARNWLLAIVPGGSGAGVLGQGSTKKFHTRNNTDNYWKIKLP